MPEEVVNDLLAKAGHTMKGFFHKANDHHAKKAAAHKEAAESHTSMMEAHKDMMEAHKAAMSAGGDKEHHKAQHAFHKAAHDHHKAKASHHEKLHKAHMSMHEQCKAMAEHMDDGDADDAKKKAAANQDTANKATGGGEPAVPAAPAAPVTPPAPDAAAPAPPAAISTEQFASFQKTFTETMEKFNITLSTVNTALDKLAPIGTPVPGAPASTNATPGIQLVPRHVTKATGTDDTGI